MFSRAEKFPPITGDFAGACHHPARLFAGLPPGLEKILTKKFLQEIKETSSDNFKKDNRKKYFRKRRVSTKKDKKYEITTVLLLILVILQLYINLKVLNQNLNQIPNNVIIVI